MSSDPTRQTDQQRSTAIEHGYHEFLQWVESDVALARPSTALSLKAFAYAWAAGQVYQANLDTREPTPELATVRVPRDMLRLVLVGSRALLAIGRDVHLDIESSDVSDLDSVVRILWRALELVDHTRVEANPNSNTNPNQ